MLSSFSTLSLHDALPICVSKLLDPPARSWVEHAQAFWAFAGGAPGMPAAMRIVCLDDGTALELGNDSGDRYEIHGSADRKSTRLNSSHRCISYAVFCLKK